jgi:thymidylate synthase (FAD)
MKMKVTLKRWTGDPDLICGEAAALCYNGKNPEKSLQVAMKGGHESVLEHASFTFLIEDVSRVLLAQLTRHRLASFSVQSQRYCGCNPEDVTIPQSIKDKRFGGSVTLMMQKVTDLYDAMIKEGIPAEDARFLVPQGVKCRLMMTANARELRHFFSLRCCNRAQWEIRQLADEMLRQCKGVAPMIFADAGAGCVRGKCPEGAKSCGNPRRKEG